VDEELPRRPRSHVVGDQGARLLQNSLPAEWVYRDLEGKGDYGVDGEVEIFETETPTGLFFRVQLRSHSTCSWSPTGEHVEPVKQSTRNYWRLQMLPVVVILCDVESKVVYWGFADEGETQSGVHISRENALPASAQVLRRGVANRLNVLGSRSLLLMAPVFDRHWTELTASTGGDVFLPINEEMLGAVKMVYAQLPLLRYALSLPPASLVPWEVWIARSRMAFDDCAEIHWAVFDEIIQYLAPQVRETLDAAARRLARRDPLAGDVTGLDWALGRLGKNYSYVQTLSFEGDREFWVRFDDHLKARGLRTFSAVDAFDRQGDRSGLVDETAKTKIGPDGKIHTTCINRVHTMYYGPYHRARGRCWGANSDSETDRALGIRVWSRRCGQ